MRLLVVTVAVVAFAAFATTAAFAGEITGNGKTKWTNTDRWTDPSPAIPSLTP